MRLLLVVAGLILTGAVLFLFAEPLCGCSTRTPGYTSSMKSDLRNLVTAQEAYFADHGAFSTDLAALQFVATPQVTVTVLHADARGWAARATHVGFESGSYAGADCVAVNGTAPTVPTTTMKRRSPGAERPIVCDMDGWRSGQSRFARWLWHISR